MEKLFKKIFDSSLIRFLIVGIINTIIGAGIMFILYNFFGLSYWLSSFFNYFFGGIVSFFLNKYYTFKNNYKSIKQVLLFIINILFCYFIGYFISKKIIYIIFNDYNNTVKENISMLLGMCLYTLLNYIGQKFIIFKNEEKDERN